MQSVRRKIRIFYPEPTVWSGHPLIAINSKGKSFLDALSDKELLKIAWERHGFRTGLIGTQNDPAVLSVVGIPASITKVISMPSPTVMELIIASLESK